MRFQNACWNFSEDKRFTLDYLQVSALRCKVLFCYSFILVSYFEFGHDICSFFSRDEPRRRPGKNFSGPYKQHNDPSDVYERAPAVPNGEPSADAEGLQ